MVILGLLGAAGSGKSTAAKFLVERFGARRYSFADPLKDMVKAAFDLREEQVRGTQAEKEAVDPRYNVSARWLLQRIGTEGCRNTFGKNFWTERTIERIRVDVVAATVRDLPIPLAVIDDVRFPDEARAIRSEGGTIWRLECPDRRSEADAAHASEAGWTDCPYDQVVSARMSEGSVELKRAVEAALVNCTELALATGKFREVCASCGAVRNRGLFEAMDQFHNYGCSFKSKTWVLEEVG